MSAIVINFFGGPGSRKSSTAAAIFAALKFAGFNCEYVSEYAKELTWKGDFNTLSDQLHVFGEQQHRLKRLVNSVKYIVTDSPLPLSIYYGRDSVSPAFNTLVWEQFDSYLNINIFLIRISLHNSYIRSQTEKEAIDIDEQLFKLMCNHYKSPDPFDLRIKGDQESFNEILKCIFKKQIV